MNWTDLTVPRKTKCCGKLSKGILFLSSPPVKSPTVNVQVQWGQLDAQQVIGFKTELRSQYCVWNTEVIQMYCRPRKLFVVGAAVIVLTLMAYWSYTFGSLRYGSRDNLDFEQTKSNYHDNPMALLAVARERGIKKAAEMLPPTISVTKYEQVPSRVDAFENSISKGLLRYLFKVILISLYSNAWDALHVSWHGSIMLDLSQIPLRWSGHHRVCIFELQNIDSHAGMLLFSKYVTWHTGCVSKRSY